jgi:fructose-specific phosphotransferase system IIC component
MTFATRVVIAYVVSIVVGHLLAHFWVVTLQARIAPNKKAEKRVALLDWSLGGLERAIATTLVIWTPSLVPAFIGGWVALKFAGNWQRYQGGDDKEKWDLAYKSMAFLVGNAASFIVAIGAGMIANPDLVKDLTTPTGG